MVGDGHVPVPEGARGVDHARHAVATVAVHRVHVQVAADVVHLQQGRQRARHGRRHHPGPGTQFHRHEGQVEPCVERRLVSQCERRTFGLQGIAGELEAESGGLRLQGAHVPARPRVPDQARRHRTRHDGMHHDGFGVGGHRQGPGAGDDEHVAGQGGGGPAAPGVRFAGDGQQRHVRAHRIGAPKSADHVPVIRSPGCGIQFPSRLLGLHPGPPEWHQRVLGRVGQQGVHEVGGQVPLEVGVEQHVFVGHAVAQGVLPLANQGACAGRQSPLHVGDFVMVGPSQPVQQVGSRESSAGLVRPVTGGRDSTACAAGDRGPDGWPSTAAPSVPRRTHAPAHGTARPCGPGYRRRRRGSGGGGGTGQDSGQCVRQLPGPRGSPQEPQAAGPAAWLALPERMRRERRDLLAQVGMLALRAQVRLASVQDDGFEAMAAVIAAVFEDGHGLHIIGKSRESGVGMTGNRLPGTGHRAPAVGGVSVCYTLRSADGRKARQTASTRKKGRLAQLGERRVRNAEVGSSSLLPSTNILNAARASLPRGVCRFRALARAPRHGRGVPSGPHPIRRASSAARFGREECGTQRAFRLARCLE